MATAWAWALWIMKQLGLAGCAIGALLIFFLGLPWIGGIPFIGHVPLIGDIATGYVERERRAAVADATKDMVAASRLATTKAELLKLQRELAFAESKAAAAEAQKLAADTVYSAKIEALEKQINADDDPDISRWTERDFDRLR